MEDNTIVEDCFLFHIKLLNITIHFTFFVVKQNTTTQWVKLKHVYRLNLNHLQIAASTNASSVLFNSELKFSFFSNKVDSRL